MTRLVIRSRTELRRLLRELCFTPASVHGWARSFESFVAADFSALVETAQSGEQGCSNCGHAEHEHRGSPGNKHRCNVRFTGIEYGETQCDCPAFRSSQIERQIAICAHCGCEWIEHGPVTLKCPAADSVYVAIDAARSTQNTDTPESQKIAAPTEE